MNPLITALCITSIFAGILLGMTFKQVEINKTHDAYVDYIEGVKRECNHKIAQAKGIE